MGVGEEGVAGRRAGRWVGVVERRMRFEQSDGFGEAFIGVVGKHLEVCSSHAVALAPAASRAAF